MADKLSARQARERLEPGYEVLPIEVIELLVQAGFAAYYPALGGANSDLFERVKRATTAADNVLARYRERTKS
jgi:hypothetical protein